MAFTIHPFLPTLPLFAFMACSRQTFTFLFLPHLVKGIVVPVHTMQAHRWSRGIAPFILNLSD
jgi:hypothetical protein